VLVPLPQPVPLPPIGGPAPLPLPVPLAAQPALPALPAVPMTVPPAALPAPNDALRQMLAVSTGWHVVPAAVSWMVSVVAWAALSLDLAVAFVLAWRTLPFGFLGEIATLGGHSAILASVAGLAAAVLGVVALRTGGFRRANRAWFRVWTLGLVLSALAVAPLVAATVAGMLIVALCVGAALALLMALLAGLAGGL